MKLLIAATLLLMCQWSFGQQFTRKDSLQGGQRTERSSFDVSRYNIDIKIDPDQRSIQGFNEIVFNTTQNTSKIQIDLFENMQVDSIIYQKKKLRHTREFHAVFISFDAELQKNTQHTITFYYSGKPVAAKQAPWDGGFDWKKDSKGNHWVGVAVQGTGASLWLPIKDTQDDEPNLGASIKV